MPFISKDVELAQALSKFYDDPLGYVMFAFPWDTEASLQVVRLPKQYQDRFNCEWGPDLWACEFLDQLGAEIRKRGFDGTMPVEPVKFSTVSGHEIGKTALVAWLIKFILDTRPFSKGSVTAVTDEQLRTKTWAELGKWHYQSVTAHWFNFNTGRGAMSLAHVDPKYAGTWRCDAKTCREEKSEAFAGQHAPTATSFYIFDEASGIPSKVFEVREGGLTSGEPMVFDFGNGTRNSGAFFENCAGKMKHRYITRSIDSRSVAITNKAKIAQDAADWGEDSDYFRVRWRGLFPAAGSCQFISSEDVEEAMRRPLAPARLDPLIIGVDVARFGEDESVIWPRIGNDARSFPPRRFRGLDTVQLAGKVIEVINEFRVVGVACSGLFVDETGIGGGVVDYLRHLGYGPIGVQFSGKTIDTKTYRFKSDEIWGRMREAVKRGLCLPTPGSELATDVKTQLTQREYGFQNGYLRLETKDSMKERGLPSPDLADALAVTFAAEVAPAVDLSLLSSAVHMTKHDYDPFAEERI